MWYPTKKLWNILKARRCYQLKWISNQMGWKSLYCRGIVSKITPWDNGRYCNMVLEVSYIVVYIRVLYWDSLLTKFFRYPVGRGCRLLRWIIQLATKWNVVFLYQYLVVEYALFTLLSLHLRLFRTKACSKGNNKNGIDTNKLTLQKAFNKSLINWRQQQ